MLKRFKSRDNSGPEDFYRKAVYIPMLDNIISDVTDRFSERLVNFVDVNIVIPSNLVNVSDADLKQKVSQLSANFAKLLNEDEMQLSYHLQCKIPNLKQSIKSQSCKPFTTLEETVINLDEEIFPTISKLALHYSCFE